jgi:hypothetical protein
VSTSVIEPALREIAEWRVIDCNARVGRSSLHPQLALSTPDLLAEMDRFGIETALVSHFMTEEYDITRGNASLANEVNARLIPVWAASPEPEHIQFLADRKAVAARLAFAAERNNFSSAPWCCGELCDFLQQHSIVTLIARDDIEWNALAVLLENFPRLCVILLQCGYRVDRMLPQLLRRFPNLYFDISNYVAHRQLEHHVERWGAERAIFGSRLPLFTPGTPLAVLASARIPDQAKLAIAGGNLRRLLRENP